MQPSPPLYKFTGLDYVGFAFGIAVMSVPLTWLVRKWVVVPAPVRRAA